jgi:hypothetical protein
MTIRQIKATPERTAETIDERALPPDWMTFPALNEAWMHSVDGTIELMAERSKTFQALIASSPPAERARARLIAQSYVRVHAVLLELHATHKTTTSAERTTF